MILGLLASAWAGGQSFPVAPPVPPGRVAPAPPDLLRAAIDRRNQGDLRVAAWYYESFLAQKGGTARTRAAAQLALGLTWLELGAPNLASALFSKVRASGTPVAPWGAWYEALADHRRGRHAVAARECASYRSTWPQGEHADECLVLMGDAWVAAGERGPAVAAYSAYLDKHPDTPREETLRLGMALAVTNGDPKAGIPLLQNLLVDHAYHSTGETAQARLDALAAKGFDTKVPDTVTWQSRRAAERKRCGFDVEAWAMFQDLAGRAADDPQLAAWIDRQEESFAWSARQYDTLATGFSAEYAAKPTSDMAWKRYRALSRGGRWAEAAEVYAAGMKAHPGAFRSRTDLGRAQLAGGRYAEARETWTALGKTGGGAGREARWLAAYASFRAGDFADALTRLDAVIAGGGDEADAARYYRARALDALERPEEAEAQRQQILAAAPSSWYALLIRSAKAPGGDRWIERVGRWPGPTVPQLPPLARVGPGSTPLAGPAAERVGERPIQWAKLAWGHTASTDATTAAAAVATPSIPYHARPDSYRPSFLYDPSVGDTLLTRLGEEQKVAFPNLAAAADLARVGIWDHAAPIVGRMYDALEEGGPGIPALSDLRLDASEWRQVFLFARDDHHTARYCWGASKMASNEAERLDALRCAFPSAQADALFRHGQAYDVDPLLAMGLMRQESVYRQWALSPVGAMGLMQVMPRTGSRVAALMGDPHYSPEQLEDPATNVRYGVWYLSRLMERFGGAFPLAVASYNGGPHNVSSWLRPWGANIRMDDYVEQIPYTETRDYVKKVTGYYATYTALYGPPGARVVVPAVVTKDDASVIDF